MSTCEKRIEMDQRSKKCPPTIHRSILNRPRMSSTTTITMEHAMKQAITAAFMAMENNTYDRTLEYKEYINIMLGDLFGILFPGSPSPAVAAPEPKKKAPKKAKKVDPEPAPIQDGPAAAGAGAPAEEPAPEPKKKAPKKAKKEEAPAPTSTSGFPGWTKSSTSRVKPVLKELGLTMNITPAKQKEFTAHLNGLSEADYNARTFEEHMRDYLRASVPAPPAPKPVSDGGRAAAGDDGDEVEMTEVTFKGTTYLVDTRNPDAMSVYNAEGTKYLGLVDSGDFAGMKVTPDDTDEE